MNVAVIDTALAEVLSLHVKDLRERPTMSLTQRQKQTRFNFMWAMLILKAHSLGFETTTGETYDDDGVGHMKRSLHYERLAGDLNLFKDGVYLTDGSHHRELGKWWMNIGGSWFEKDGNHYSLSPDGVRK